MRPFVTLLFLPFVGCMTMDSFFMNGTRVSAYSLASDVIPAAALEEVSFETEDGLRLYGVWAHQIGSTSTPLLYFHGNADNIDAYMRQLGDYWGMGYEVFIFDYRGFGKSEGSSTFEGVGLDGVAAVEYFSDRVGAEIGTFPYLGLSLGGSVAARTAITHPPSVLITEDMFASGQTLINDGSSMDMPDGWLLADEWDNAATVAQVHVPYLIIHGDSDTFIQPSHAEEVYAAANEPKVLWFVEGSNHAEDSLADPEGYTQHVMCWIEQSCVE